MNLFDLSNLPLFITNVSYIFFFFLTVLFGLWVYLKSSRKKAHVMFLLMTLSIGVFQISHIFGINTFDSEASRSIFTMNTVVLFMMCFAVHWIAAAIDKEKEHSKGIMAMYIFGTVLSIVFLAFPDMYLLPSAPRMYFPNYYVAGSLYFLQALFIAIGFLFSLSMLVRARRMVDAAHKNRYSYYLAALVGYPLGAIGYLLAYNIPVDPIFSVLFNASVFPIAYGVLRYDIMDIKAAARKTLTYLIFVLVTALFIVGIHIGEDIIKAAAPGTPDWVVPLASSLIVVLFAGYMWERMRDIEVLKYEFITVVTHKFRTPLTRIKWASEVIKKKISRDEDEQLAINEIENANENLVILTDMLIDLRKANEAAYLYEFVTADLCGLVDHAVKNMAQHIADKKLRVSFSCPENQILVSLDDRRLLFAIQIVLENAITYTPSEGSVEVRLESSDPYAYIRVKDSGIGISREDLGRMFSKFWRSKEAKVTDTEGMGIGLFMAKEIIERHDGDISVQSEGLGKGATFTIRLPLAARE